MALPPSLLAPEPPDYVVPWGALQEHAWVRALEACPQDPVYHAEGNVWIHTRMVLEALCSLDGWRTLPRDERQIVYLACLLHDVAKPETTRVQPDGRITARSHSSRGEIAARRILWEAGFPLSAREQVCALVRHHQSPFFIIDRPDASRTAIAISQLTRCDWLSLVAEADLRGRVCEGVGEILDRVELFRELCREEGCYDRPRSFASPHTRFVYFREEGRHPDVEAYDDTETEAVVMAGLPGAGKDTWVREQLGGWPVVSLDDLRRELGVGHGANQGVVVQTARERARVYLRQRRPFVWNATNLQRQFRSPLIDLLVDYRARVKIVYVEAPPSTLYAQNKSREAVVPEGAIRKMLERWEVPTELEAHERAVVSRG